MKWTAHVKVFGITPQQTQNFNIIGFDANSEMDAARAATEMSAKRIYGTEGSASFVNELDAPLYRASIGYYDGRGVTRGRSIELLLIRYTHPVTGK